MQISRFGQGGQGSYEDEKITDHLLAASIVAGSAQVPGLTMQVQAAQVQTQESAGSATATYNGKTFNRASAAYQDGDVSYEGMPLYNGNAEDLDEHRSMYSYVRLSIDRCTATYAEHRSMYSSYV